MEQSREEERWVLAESTDCARNSQEFVEDVLEDDEEEALSLCDLPIIHNQFRNQEKHEVRTNHEADQDDFDFCSLSKESKMCTADEVFHQGQILPLRHSVSSETSLLHYSNGTRSVSRSESMDHYYSTELISSRSSSTNSHNSSTSSSSSSTIPHRRHPKPPRNQFHSHPSPSPRLHKTHLRSTNNVPNPPKKSSVWTVFRLGLVTPPPEIAFQDFRSRNRINSGSRNSTSSNSSGSSSKNVEEKNKKKTKDRRGFLNGSCRCSANDVVPSSRVVIIKRSASESEETRVLRLDEEEEEDSEEIISVQPTKMMKRQETKKRMSHHRTFEWLKQLSIDGAEDV